MLIWLERVHFIERTFGLFLDLPRTWPCVFILKFLTQSVPHVLRPVSFLRGLLLAKVCLRRWWLFTLTVILLVKFVRIRELTADLKVWVSF